MQISNAVNRFFTIAWREPAKSASFCASSSSVAQSAAGEVVSAAKGLMTDTLQLAIGSRKYVCSNLAPLLRSANGFKQVL
jgi:hypothetical protein